MAKHLTKESLSRQVENESKALDSSAGLPFRELISEQEILAALQADGREFRDRIYNISVTLWAFLSQVIARKDSSCSDAVSRVIVDRVAQKKKRCSMRSGSYCVARTRLPMELVTTLTRESGRELDRQAKPEWLWKNRHVKIVDGSTATMADTAENQREYPQSKNQKVGLGFPILRFVVVLSLSVGTVLECAIGSCRGKRTGEQSLFRQTWGAFESGDVVLADRLYDCYRDIALLKADGVDSVFGKKQSRHTDFRQGRRLGHDDHVVVWKKPKYDATRYESKEQWESLPDEMEIREVRIAVSRKGYRTRTVVIVTTLVDGDLYTAKELTDLFAARWHCELDLRSIKQSLGAGHLQCKTSEMVRKELWVRLLAYNLIRVRMAQASDLHHVMPRDLSFTAARNHIHNFADLLNNSSGAEHRRIEAELLETIASSRIKKRPGRKEPRKVKKRVQKYSFLSEPRAKARKRLAA